MQSAGVLEQVAFQFCGKELIPPMNFNNIIIQWADVPLPLQSGDVVIAC